MLVIPLVFFGPEVTIESTDLGISQDMAWRPEISVCLTTLSTEVPSLMMA